LVFVVAVVAVVVAVVSVFSFVVVAVAAAAAWCLKLIQSRILEGVLIFDTIHNDKI
jgi:hypothetical protein